MIRVTSEAICETAGSMMNQHCGKNRFLQLENFNISLRMSFAIFMTVTAQFLILNIIFTPVRFQFYRGHSSWILPSFFYKSCLEISKTPYRVQSQQPASSELKLC